MSENFSKRGVVLSSPCKIDDVSGSTIKVLLPLSKDKLPFISGRTS